MKPYFVKVRREYQGLDEPPYDLDIRGGHLVLDMTHAHNGDGEWPVEELEGFDPRYWDGPGGWKDASRF